MKQAIAQQQPSTHTSPEQAVLSLPERQATLPLNSNSDSPY